MLTDKTPHSDLALHCLLMSIWLNTSGKYSIVVRRACVLVSASDLFSYWIYINPYDAKKKLHLKMLSIYVVCWIFLQTFQNYFCLQANSMDPHQTAPRAAVWSGSTLFEKWLLKSQQMAKQMTVVVIGSLRLNFLKRAHFTLYLILFLKFQQVHLK